MTAYQLTNTGLEVNTEKNEVYIHVLSPLSSKRDNKCLKNVAKLKLLRMTVTNKNKLMKKLRAD
jgi:hypothetical protein